MRVPYHTGGRRERRPQKVQVFALGRPRPGSDRAQRRYYVKWRVGGRDRTRSFKTRIEADRFRSGAP